MKRKRRNYILIYSLLEIVPWQHFYYRWIKKQQSSFIDIYSKNAAFESTQNMTQIWQTRDIRNDVIIMRGRIPLYSVVLSGVPLGKPYGICERNSTNDDPHSLITVFPVGICRLCLSGNLDREKQNLENLLKCAPEIRWSIWECTLRTRLIWFLIETNNG